LPVAGPPHTIRVALTDFRWPLDPALASTRDETTLSRALYPTPLRTDTAGRVVPGLCRAWAASDGFRTWRFRCAHALEVSAALRRVARLRASPANWIFSRVDRITVPAPGDVVVRLRSPWRRFPYALTSAQTAPRSLPGPFRLVRGSRNSVEVARDGVRLVFRRLSGLAVLRALHAGQLDEAPIPLGDAGLFRSDASTLRVRELLGADVVAFRRGAVARNVRTAYWQTANRGDYCALVAQDGAPPAFSLVGTVAKADPAAYRRAVKSIPSLPRLAVPIGVPPDPVLRYGSRILYAQWRELGLGPRIVRPDGGADADIERIVAVYPQEEALLGGLGRATALAAGDQRGAFERLDDELRTTAEVIPVCWVADARWVSPRLRGWHEDVLGDVDYMRVTVGG